MEETLGKRISSNRKRMKLTQDQLAERLGVTAQAVSKWENDQSCPDISIIPRLADIFGITTDVLLGREEPKAAIQGEVVEDDSKSGIHLQKGDWELHYDSGKRGAITFAAFVLLVGVLTLLSRVLTWDVSFWNILWPSALLVFGIGSLFPRFSVFFLGVALLGCYFLINNLGVWELNIGNDLLLPIVILVFGLGLLIDALCKHKKPRFSFTHSDEQSKKARSTLTESGEHFDCSLSFCENSYAITLPRVSSGEASVSFGELTLDLTQCEEIAANCDLDLSCSFGELTLLVPKHCRIIPDSSTSFGSLEFKGHSEADASVILNVDVSASFGSIVICYV